MHSKILLAASLSSIACFAAPGPQVGVFQPGNMVPKNISPPGDGYGVDKIDKMNGFPNKQLYKDGELEHMGKPIPYGLPPVNGYNKQDVDGFNGDDDDAYDQIRPNGHKLHRNAATKSLAVSGAGTLVIVSSMVFGVAFSSNSLSLF